ncbi:divalent-cation tolerance protein CutA [Erythrobacter rubeus]|uniref:Divalent-cation tolerance protein CutA n=1 Tax=Erythrobacter rubeus TaxID=2760803 RepID=A0ABR8KQZ8_9SPHN|nr:divalent-cation tolerance protein CutA [Erythrobacter rubeus]MBD2843174.1 divalent-cation tolerance protein CutA [Erythrobacter rubeus]
MRNTGAALVWCPFPDRETARATAARLLDESLIACANIVGEIESIFEWEGERSSGTEIAVLLKTTSERLEEVVSRLGELHPYDTPAIVGWCCDQAYPATLDWLMLQTRPTLQ